MDSIQNRNVLSFKVKKRKERNKTIINKTKGKKISSLQTLTQVSRQKCLTEMRCPIQEPKNNMSCNTEPLPIKFFRHVLKAKKTIFRAWLQDSPLMQSLLRSLRHILIKFCKPMVLICQNHDLNERKRMKQP